MTATSESYLVIGGSGFLGRSIVEALLKRGEKSVSTLDIVQRYHDVPHYTADITDSAKLRDVFERTLVTTIIHTASPVHNLSPEIYYKVNVQGTLTIVQCAMARGVPRLVFTSSSGVIDAGIPLIDADERMPYPDKFLDAYNESKALAEKIVLEANGRNGLLTVALRPAGIFGPGDRQVIPGLAKVVNDQKTHFQIGNNTNLYDLTYIDNVVHAHILAADRLLECSSQPAASYQLPRSALVEYSLDYPSLSTGSKRVLTSEAKPLGPVSPDRKATQEELMAAKVFDSPEYVEGRPVTRTKFDPLSDTALDLEDVVVSAREDTERITPDEQQHTNGAADPPLDSPFLPESVTFNEKGTSLPHPASTLTPNVLQVPGQTFIITNGEPVYFWDFARSVWSEMGDQTIKRVVLSKSIGLVFGTVLEWASWFMGKEPSLTRFRVAVTSNPRWFNIEKARRVLGYEPQVGLQEGIKRSVAWHKEQVAKGTAPTH